MDRRAFLTGALGASVAVPAIAAVNSSEPVLRTSLDGAELGIRPGIDAGRVLQRLLDSASLDDRQIFLPAGTHVISELRLPPRTRLAGVPGATRLVFTGGGHMVTANRAEHISLTGLIFDGAGLPLDEYAPGLVHIASARNVTIHDCVFEGSTKAGLALDRCSGQVSNTKIRNCAGAGLRAVESTGLSITNNVVEDCGNGGILVFRWTTGEDGTIVSGNRVERIRADNGDTGRYGNAIHVFRAGSVMIANNRIADCAFSAIRASSAENIQITGNNCLRSGTTAIYSEYSFEGAVISNNIVDGAGNGIRAINFSKGGRTSVINANVVRNLHDGGPADSKSGTGISVEADSAVTGNVIESAPRAGMILGYGPYLRDVSATGNVIRDAGIGIGVSIVEGAGAAVVTDNLISGTRRGAIIGMMWEKRASGDLAGSDPQKFRHLQVERNRVS
jgi:uncharacterized secreted repeat protein (TIGR03808 family)